MDRSSETLTKRFRVLRGLLGVSSVALLVFATANFFGLFSPYRVSDGLLNSIQYLLVALVILSAVGLQRASSALQSNAQDRQETASGEDVITPAPIVPSGPAYASARRKATIFQVTAVVVLAGSFIVVPKVGDLLMSNGSSFETFNAFMIGIGVLLVAAAVASKYFTHKAREAGRQSIREQEESLS